MFQDKNQDLEKLSDWGEFRLIEHLNQAVQLSNKSSLLGIGDDAAMIKPKGNMLVSTDLLIEGVHFELGYMPLKHLGYKSVVVNLSDIYAMNGNPEQITVSLAMSNRFTIQAVEELYAGILLAASVYGVDVVGGDTTSSTKGLTISITAIGTVDKSDVVKRSGAKPNDLLVLTGDVGAAFMGFKILQREQEVFKVNPKHQADLEPYQYLIERQLKPEARKDIPPLLKALKLKPTAMIDVSDGLSSEVIHLSKQSLVGARIYEDKLPLDPVLISTCEEFNLDATTLALNGGEDYELLFSIAPQDYDKIKGNPNLTVIGHCTEAADGVHLVTRMGDLLPLKAGGWNAFKED